MFVVGAGKSSDKQNDSLNVTSGFDQYSQGMFAARIIAEQVCQLSLPGPAVRVMAMSICI